MDNNFDNKYDNSIHYSEELEETWENIRLPENMVDNSFNFNSKKYKLIIKIKNSFSLLDYIKSVTIDIDLNKNEDQLEVLNNHDFENEFRILQQLIDYHPNSEKRLYEPTDSRKNRYCDISPCKLIICIYHRFNKISTKIKS